MIIHVVAPGDTIFSIADTYQVTPEKLIRDNGLEELPNLIIGQTIVIVYPEISYVVQEGDSLESIANNYGITIKQILRNNPYLSDRDYIYPGDIIVIQYNHSGTITTNGFVYPFIDLEILRKTLPLLTYLTIFNYRVTAEGDLISLDDVEIINMARNYGVAPIMLLSPISFLGIESNVAYNILYNEAIQDHLISNVLNTMESKGYYGLNIYFENVNPEVLDYIEKYLTKFTIALNKEGYPVTITLTPTTFDSQISAYNGNINFSNIGVTVNNVLLLSYAWGYSYGPPGPVTPVDELAETVINMTKQIPPEKTDIGITVMGYDWELPYSEGMSRASALSLNKVLHLAAVEEAVIMFDEPSMSAYFYYDEYRDDGEITNHIVWFKDARTISALLDLITANNLRGVSIWNTMEFNTQLWLIINASYDIENVL